MHDEVVTAARVADMPCDCCDAHEGVVGFALNGPQVGRYFWLCLVCRKKLASVLRMFNG